MAIDWKYMPHLVDNSGSMEDYAREAISGYKGRIKRLQESPLSTLVSLSTFDDQVYEAYTNVNVADAKGLDECGVFDPATGGGTCLYDSILSEINRHEALLAEIKRTRKARELAEGELEVVMAILTDGHDTSSKKTIEDVRVRIEQKRREGWEFIFIGPDKDLGLKLGIAEENSRALGPGGRGMIEAFEVITERTERLMLGTGS